MRCDRKVTGDLGESSASRVVGDRTQAEWGGRTEEGLYLVLRVGMKKIYHRTSPHYKSNVSNVWKIYNSIFLKQDIKGPFQSKLPQAKKKSKKSSLDFSFQMCSGVATQ